MSATSLQRPRHRVRRSPRKARYERPFIEDVLDRALVAHVAFSDGDGQPCCIPMLHARVDDRLYIHGSTASRLVRTLAAGAAACVTVTIVRGLVLARSAFEHSANFDSVVLHGRFELIDDPDERLTALRAFTDRLIPGRWSEVRPPSRKELKATQMLAIAIDEASGKTRSGPPDDDDSEDAAIDTWAGELPVLTTFGEPVPAPGLRPGIPLAASVRRLVG